MPALTPRFISDVMLGSLSKWLRILGFDVIYFNYINDNELIKISKQQERIVLTRDVLLAQNKKVSRCIHISSDKTFDQVKEVISKLKDMGYDMVNKEPRCAICNGEIEKVEKKSITNEVPEHVLLRFQNFFRCRDCSRVYWEGTHKRAIDKIKEQLLSL